MEGRHKSCNFATNGRSCLHEAYIRLFSGIGDLVYEFVIGQDFSAEWVYGGTGDVPRNIRIPYDYVGSTQQLAWFRIEEENDRLQVKIFTARISSELPDYIPDIRIRISEVLDEHGWISIWIAQCWMNTLCGLCGTYDNIISNDFTKRDSNVLFLNANITDIANMSWFLFFFF